MTSWLMGCGVCDSALNHTFVLTGDAKPLGSWSHGRWAKVEGRVWLGGGSVIRCGANVEGRYLGCILNSKVGNAEGGY